MRISHEDGEYLDFEMKYDNAFYSVSVSFKKTGKYSYYFVIGNENYGVGSFRQAATNAAMPYRQTVFSSGYKTPSWIKGKTMYQIFPDRFYRSKKIAAEIDDDKIFKDNWGGEVEFRPNEQNKILNNDFFGGNIRGIIEKLPYLKQMGAGIIYLNPIFEAYSNHRYDVGDYFKIDKLLGTDSDFSALIEKADKLGIKIILDMVFSHTGSDSVYFNKLGRYDSLGAYQSKKSPYYKWYTFKHFPDDYECWWGVKTLPQINENIKSFTDFICGKSGVLNHWLSLGIGGIRLDVADELPDSFLKKVRKNVKSFDGEIYILGEVWEDATDKISYGIRKQYLEGKTLDSVMNYALKNAIINTVLNSDFSYFREAALSLLDNYPKFSRDCLMNILGTHDTVRILTALNNKHLSTKEQMSTYKMSADERQAAFLKLKVATLLQFTVFGVPCIYYGDEAGAEGYADPFNRTCFDWEQTDNHFSKWYKTLAKLRNRAEYTDGDYNEIYADKKCLVFERRNKDSNSIIAINLSSREYIISLDGLAIDFLSGKRFKNSYILQPNSLSVLI